MKEQDRLHELYSYAILDTPAEESFNEIVELASDIAGMPMSVITLIDQHRQWFKARIGLDRTETPIEESFCAIAIQDAENDLIVKDASKDPRFMDNPNVVGDMGVRFYAGFPLVTQNGAPLGTLCVIDHKPNTLSSKQIERLRKLSRQAMKLIELHISHKKLENLHNLAAMRGRNLKTLLSSQKIMMAILAHDTKGPIVSIEQTLRLFERKKFDADELRSLVPLMSTQTRDVIDMINGLIDWGKLSISSLHPAKKAHDLSGLVQEVLQAHHKEAKKKELELSCHLEEVKIRMHPEVIKFCIRNLVSNAIKFTHKGEVKISGQRVPDGYEISVRDTGVGMDAQTLKSFLFLKSLSRPGTKGEAGNGLGLGLLVSVLREMECHIKVSKARPHGTLVRISLPGKYIR